MGLRRWFGRGGPSLRGRWMRRRRRLAVGVQPRREVTQQIPAPGNPLVRVDDEAPDVSRHFVDGAEPGKLGRGFDISLGNYRRFAVERPSSGHPFGAVDRQDRVVSGWLLRLGPPCGFCLGA